MIPILDIMLSNLWKPVIKVFTTCTTRCRFVNVAFGFAARKASRHQLYKHVNAHVYLGVLAYYAKQRPSRCWDPHDHVDNPFCVAQLSYSQIWEIQIGSCESRISCNSGSGKHIFTFTLISCTAKSGLWVWGSNRARVSRRTCICCVPKYTRVGCTGVARASPSCVRAFALHVYALDTRYHDYMP